MLNNDGGIEKLWEGMANLATDFFSNILGDRANSQPTIDAEALQQVLSTQTEKLTQLEKEVLNAPITLGELGEATLALTNDECPSPNGVPVEFYKAQWQWVGPLVHQCITLGIEEEAFPEYITKGFIVLLKKKADQRNLANKWPIMLLNTI